MLPASKKGQTVNTSDLSGADYDILALCIRHGAESTDPVWLAHQALHDLGDGPIVRIDRVEHATAIARLALEMLAKAKPTEPGTTPTQQAVLGDAVPIGPKYTVPFDRKSLGRLLKVLEKRYSFDGHVMTLRERLQELDLTRRSEYIRRYASKKRNGYNAELASPKHEYTVWYQSGERERGIDVPKIVYDALQGLPATVSAE